MSEKDLARQIELCKPSTSPEVVSIPDVISSRAKLVGRTITTSGYYGLAEDESALYASEQAFERRSTKDGVWINGSFDPALAGKYVRVTGVVTSRQQWLGFSWPLTVCGVTSIQAASRP
jgi:hypothetical protein